MVYFGFVVPKVDLVARIILRRLKFMVNKKSKRIVACLLTILLVVTSTFCMGTIAASAADTDVQVSEAGGATAVLKNAANWGSCYVYYWGNGGPSNGGTQNAAWPGTKLTDADKNSDGYYEVEIPESFLSGQNGIIFHNNSGAQSADLAIASGDCKLFNNSDYTWVAYDTNPLKLNLTADVESPQYKGTAITLTATASGGSGTYTYTFKAGTTTIYTGSNNTCTWTPTAAGTFDISVECNDPSKGYNNTKKISSYVIKDDATAVEPILKGISTGYTDNKVPVNASVAINVSAAGGKIGTNLLFYKVAVKNPSGGAVNTVYYKQSNILNFTPTTKGTYTVEVTVQNSHNEEAKRTFTVIADNSSTPVGNGPVITGFTANPTSATTGSAVTLKTVLKSGTGTADFTYTYRVNGNTIATKTSSSTSNSVSWTPSAEGSYTVQVTVKDKAGETATAYIYNFEVKKADYKLGDVTGDGKISTGDALYVLKSVANLSAYKLTPGTAKFMAADIDANGKITVADALAIMKLYI